jgi:GNAT superfamily N-acetyltransferase
MAIMVNNECFENKINYKSIVIERLQHDHIQQVQKIWRENYETASCIVEAAPELWLKDTSYFRDFISEHIDKNMGIAALVENKVVGYMVYDNFQFHGENTVFCPVMGHASISCCKEIIYKKMYQNLSNVWVKDGCLNHLITFFAHESNLKEQLFNLGFGLYVVDAYRRSKAIETRENHIKILKADISHIEDVAMLGEESGYFYMEAPLFLARDSEKKEYYEELLKNNNAAVFLAYDGDRAVGFTNVRRQEEEDVISLSDQTTGMLDPMGAYIKPNYRGCGLGESLLKEVILWCGDNKLQRIHVDFEAANLFGSKFWIKYFTPLTYSVKRRINQDAV